MDRTSLVWMDIMLIPLQIITQWLTQVDADAVDLVGAVVTAEGDGAVAVVVAERTMTRNGTQTVPNPTPSQYPHPRLVSKESRHKTWPPRERRED